MIVITYIMYAMAYIHARIHTCPHTYVRTLHYVSLHYIPLRYVTLHYVTYNAYKTYITYITRITYIYIYIYMHACICYTPACTTLIYIASDYVTLHYSYTAFIIFITVQRILFHHITSHYMHYTAFIALHYITLRYIQYIALHHFTFPYMHYITLRSLAT